MKAKHVRYRLEGYLYPATYEVEKNTSLKSLVEQMVAKTNQIVIPHLAKSKIRDEYATIYDSVFFDRA